MTRIVLLSVLALCAGLVFTYRPVKWTNLYATWNIWSYLSRVTDQAFFKMPLSTSEATDEGWVQAASNNITSTWCLPDDLRVCVIYDLRGTVAGMQISIPIGDVQYRNIPYDFTAHPLFIRNNLFNTDVYTARYYLVDQGTLAAGGRARSREVGTGLWLQSGDRFIEVPRDSAQMEKQHWTRVNCVLGMGRHYYYNVSKQMACENYEPFFPLVDHRRDALHGLGFQIFGKSSFKRRKWFEFVPIAAVKSTLPNSPDCLEEWVSKTGIISIHMYFVEKPWFILC